MKLQIKYSISDLITYTLTLAADPGIARENMVTKGPNISHRGLKHHTLQILPIYFPNSGKQETAPRQNL